MSSDRAPTAPLLPPHAHATADASSSGPPAANSTRCDCCESCGALLELAACGHRFHPRCIYAYPIQHCEICATRVTRVRLLRASQQLPNSMARKGKWSADEHKYANLLMKQFQIGALPLVDGLHLRGFIANVLQCDPLRVTKKYAGHAIGKQNFFYQRAKSFCYNLHTKLQKRISNLRTHFYWHLQYRGKLPAGMNVQALKAAEADYWIREFMRFAERIGQSVELPAMPVPVPVSVPVKVPSLHGLPMDADEQEQEQEQELLAIAMDQDLPTCDDSLAVIKTEEGEADPLGLTSGPAPAPAPALPDKQGRADSPISFDEWTEDSPMLEDALAVPSGLASISQPSSLQQFSHLLSDLGAPTPLVLEADAVAMGMPVPSVQTPVPSTPSSNLHASLRDWLNEEEARWTESMTAASWSFSLTLSDAAEAPIPHTIY